VVRYLAEKEDRNGIGAGGKTVNGMIRVEQRWMGSWEIV